MDKILAGCKKYVTEVLANRVELANCINKATILLNAYEDGNVWDLMILLDDNSFKHTFSRLHGECFVIDDHKHNPPVFTRIKSYEWLAENFSKRLPIALWIFQNAIVVQKRGNLLRQVIKKRRGEFDQNLQRIIKIKYLEMRSERHNLRYSLTKPDDMANALLKANIIKLCLELFLLADGKPYPFRVLLPDYVKNNVTNSQDILLLAQDFLTTTDPKTTISLSNKLIERIVAVLQKKKLCSDDFLLKWWLHLD